VRREREAFLLVAVRLAYWGAAVLALLWAPVRGDNQPPFHVYGPISDLVFGAFAQWDSSWFVHVAEHGYDSEHVTVFFPVYPLVVHVVALVVRDTVVAGVLVSLASGFAAAAAIARIARPLLGAQGAWDTVLLLALYPISFVFTAVYSDGLFLALAAWAFVFALRGNGLAAGVLGALAMGTRVVGLALLPPLVLLLRRRGRLQMLAPFVLIPAALVAYMLYLRHRFGDAFAFVHSEAGSDWNRAISHAGPVGGLKDAVSSGWHGALELVRHLPPRQGAPAGYALRDQWAIWNVVHLLLLAAAVWLTVVAWRRLGAAYGLYSACVIAFYLSTPADLVPLVSEPRFLLVDFPLFMALALYARRQAVRTSLIVLFATLGGIAAVAFSHHVWVA
jgi:hypothetical protein